MLDDLSALVEFLRATRLVGRFVGDANPAEFQSDIKSQSAVLHQLIVLGEAVKRLSNDFRANHPAIDWRGFAGMRDVLTHQYDEVDLAHVWKTAIVEIHELIKYLEPVVSTLEANEELPDGSEEQS